MGNPASRGPPDLAQIGKPANKNYGNYYGNCGPQDQDQISNPENKNFLTLELEVRDLSNSTSPHRLTPYTRHG